MATITRYRSSVDGRLVPTAYALRNPTTTQRHQFRLPEDENPHEQTLGFLLEGFNEAPLEDKAEWQIEIQDCLTEWRKADIAEMLTTKSDG